jgi:hypothetical protein
MAASSISSISSILKFRSTLYINKSNKQLIQDLQQDMLELSVNSSNMADGSLSIAKTSGLQGALNDKQDIFTFISGNNVTISHGTSNDGPTVHIAADLDYSQIDTSHLVFI